MSRTDEPAKVRAASLSVASNSALVAGKLAVGLSIGSVSVISEAIHSAVDLMAAVIAWFAVRLSGQPADKEHPYGHGKYENLSGAIEAALIFAAAIMIVWEAVAKLRHGGAVDAPVWGVGVMAVSAGVNLLVSGWLMRVGNATDSMALKADAVHLRTDVWTSVGVLSGLAIIWVGRFVAPGLDLHWVDPVAAIAVALLIVRAAWVLALQASHGLLDESLPQDDIDYIRRTALDRGDIRSLHDLKTRKSGPERIIDAHVAVDYSLTVLEGHDKGKSFKRTLLDQWPMSWVNIHVDPCDGSCKAPCLSGCLLSPPARAAEHAAWTDRQAKT
ncbi:MAG TPA: cation diffusion facilitator family transporter [Fibrobacteria bacterium]|nr:cation diffusion facilitator family transporter [Fibrobacteria bacterium]